MQTFVVGALRLKQHDVWFQLESVLKPDFPAGGTSDNCEGKYS